MITHFLANMLVPVYNQAVNFGRCPTIKNIAINIYAELDILIDLDQIVIEFDSVNNTKLPCS